MEGWIKLHRVIMQHGFYYEKPFSKLSAWIDLLLCANHVDNKVYFDGNFIEVKRSQLITSIRKLCERWGWSNTKVVRFLECLKNESQIHFKSDTKKTVITIVNYDLYQNEKTQKHFKNDAETSQKHTNKNVKNEKNDKNLKDPSLPSHDCKNLEKGILNEYQKYLNDHNIERQQRVLEYLDKGLDSDVIIECIRESVTGNMPCKYVFGILDNCVNQKVFTLAQYIERKKEHIKQVNAQLDKSKNKRDPNYANYDQREYKEEELEKFYISGTNRIDLKTKKIKEIENED